MNFDSAGLMPQIQALIAFPPGTYPSKPKVHAHKYTRRPGRSHNHDYCDSCLESGDLLCCDTCNASFYLLCINPPLEYEQLPVGGWRCHRCKSTQSESGQESGTNNKSSKSRRAGKKRSAPQAPAGSPSNKKALFDLKTND